MENWRKSMEENFEFRWLLLSFTRQKFKCVWVKANGGKEKKLKMSILVAKISYMSVN